jgi:hypothetical protein
MRMKNKTSPARTCQKTREINSQAFLKVIKQIWRNHFSERDLKDLWLKELRKNKNLSYSGWYSPPPNGTSILIAGEDNPQRLGYNSLRAKKYWSQKSIIFNPQTGIVFAYTSFLDRKTGILGDFGMTLYAGHKPEIIEYLKRVLRVNQQIVAGIKPGLRVKDIYHKSIKILRIEGLINKSESMIDSAGINIGHSVPGTLEPFSKSELGEIKVGSLKEISKIISKKRIFINKKNDYVLKPGDCFTLEPSLIDSSKPYLPRALFHTIVVINKDGSRLIENFEEIFRATGMDYMLSV